MSWWGTHASVSKTFIRWLLQPWTERPCKDCVYWARVHLGQSYGASRYTADGWVGIPHTCQLSTKPCKCGVICCVGCLNELALKR